MSREEIIAMAKDAGLLPDTSHPTTETRHMRQKAESVHRFAALVEAKEREVCAQALENLVADHVASTRKSKNKLDWCAADDRSCEYVNAWSDGAAAIRARSTT